MLIFGFVVWAIALALIVVLIYGIVSQLTDRDDLEQEPKASKALLNFMAKDSVSATILVLYIIALIVFVVYYIKNDLSFETATSIYVALIALFVIIIKSQKDLLKYYTHPALTDSDKLEARKKAKETIYDLFGLLTTYLLSAAGIITLLSK